MHIDELETPIRLSWDLQLTGEAMSAADCARAVAAINSAGLFFVTLEQQPLLHPQFSAIAGELSEAGIQLSATCSGSADELKVLADLETLPITLLLDLRRFVLADGIAFQEVESVVAALRAAGYQPLFSLVPQRSNIGFLLPLLELAATLEIPRFKLPNVRIDDNFLPSGADELLGPKDLENFAARIADNSHLPESLELEIHDLFLWEILAPDRRESRSEYGGCQAANSLAHLRVDGAVWPCLSWPLPLGTLREQSFAEIWSSTPRVELRKRVATTPAGCKGCSDYSICFGGCRGLAESLNSSDDRDPLCSGTR